VPRDRTAQWFATALQGSGETGPERWPEFCCPTHGVSLTDERNSLCCPLGERFPVKDGIPRFVPQETYADAFGVQWKRYRLTQLDSYSGVPITLNRIRRCLGERLWDNLTGKHVLECGCGAGRFTEILLQRGALVTSLDLSDAVEANQQNFPWSPTHRIAQADILQLPFRPRQFDIVFCLGVIPFTPRPEATIVALSKQMKSGGTLVIDHFTHSVSEFTKVAGIVRFFLKRLPPKEGLRWTERLVNFFLPLHKSVRRSRAAQVVLSRVSPVLCYYHTLPQLNDEMQYQFALLDTHNFLTCWYRRLRTRTQIERTLKSLGLIDVVCSYGGNGVEARGRRPSKHGGAQVFDGD